MLKVQYIVMLILLTGVGTSDIKSKEEGLSMRHTHEVNMVTIEPGVKHFHLISEFRVCKTDIDVGEVKSYVNGLAVNLKMPFLNEDAIVSVERHNDSDDISDIEVAAFCNNGSIRVNYWRKPRLLVLDMVCFKGGINRDLVSGITEKLFGLIESAELSTVPESAK
jgi:hypothetical protein